MKKYFVGLFAVILAIGASAFTGAQTTLGAYYNNNGVIVPITTSGFCDTGSDYCTYDLISGREDNGDPANYVGVGDPGLKWVP